ncbi:hypothetical protein GP486_001919 [Trichoglossum hirsutum]|uniref:Uncharacterized protein n=1 Tax=Trichoglossum hirsutum TaxID=265104 RepID=A0A9P8RSK7_9PEZI|nr:hypothetical protein GP486_001919 [Trichoglossum hirsutum]
MASSAGAQFSKQWVEPGDVFSVLLILGGNVIQLALAVLAGSPVLTPISFSFGWVAYAISAVLSAIGDNRLVGCPPEVGLKVINLDSGYKRDNQSWLLARLVKTYDFWMPREVKARLRESSSRTKRSPDLEAAPRKVAASPSTGAVVPAIPPVVGTGTPVALCVAVYRWADGGKAGVPSRDWLWWSGLVTTAIQLGISAIPWGLHSNWGIFIVTAGGTLLAYSSASLPQWRLEKWHARPGRKGKDVALTTGNGAQHVIIILGADGSLDLEDLASGRAPDLLSTRIFTSLLALLWLVLLITCTGIRTDTWYLLAVGSLGMLHNLLIAGAPRRPETFGLPIELATAAPSTNSPSNGESAPAAENGGGAPGTAAVPEIFAEMKVMWTLMELEEKHKGHGRALLGEFFPGKLRKWEEDWWASNDPTERRRLLGQAQEKLRQSAALSQSGKQA